MLNRKKKIGKLDSEIFKPMFDIQIVGEGKYIMMHYKSTLKIRGSKVFKCWTFFNIKSGKQVFHIDNNFIP